MQNTLDTIYEMLKRVIPAPGERATEGEKFVPDGFVPALPSDPYEILAYFGFPADSVERILAKHSHFFDGKANTEPHKSHRMALRKAFLQLCSKPNAGTKRGLTHCIRQLIHKLAPRSVWVHYCLKGHSPRKRSMEDELHRFVRIIMVVVMKIWGVDENVASTHLAEALRKESDRAGFRLTPRAKKTRGGRNGEPNAVTDNIRDDIAIASNSTDTTISRGSPSNLDKGPCDSDGDVDSIVANSDSDRSGVSDANSTLSDDE